MLCFRPGVIEPFDLNEDISAEGHWPGSGVRPFAGANAIFDGFTAFNGRPILRDDVHIHICEANNIDGTDGDLVVRLKVGIEQPGM